MMEHMEMVEKLREKANITIEDEYDHAINQCGFTYNDLITCNINSIKSSFMPEEDKQSYIDQLIKSYR